jgi:methylated-DNA-[protein]-cysteine S-methyltransferase
MKNLYYTQMNSPVGPLLLVSSEKGLVRIALPSESGGDRMNHITAEYPDACFIEDAGKNQEAVRQIEEYFSGTRKSFTLPLDLRGTDFQKKVWKAMLKVPFGRKRSYGQIARDIGNPKACRAVGGSCGKNTIAIVIPCHRIIGSDGSMTGFGGGISLKERLLDLEKKTVNRNH